MTIAIKSLGDGQLDTSKGTLYTAPASTQAIIMTITLSNTSANIVEANLYFKASGGTSRRIIPKDLEIPAKGSAVIDDVQTLEAADIIEGDASIGTTVDYTISGVEEA